jgi:hypothetical protein
VPPDDRNPFIACVGLITGAFLLLGLSPLEFTDGLFAF